MFVVFVHIGLPKTGTTHVQDRLWRNRDIALRDCGLLYPGNVIADHFHAAVHLQPERYLDWVDPAFDKSWSTMVAQMRAWPGTSLLSHELLATATEEHIAALLRDLSFADEVHVVVTVRDLVRQLPSVWQENVKNQRRASFHEFVESVRTHTGAIPGQSSAVPLADTPNVPEEPFWEFQDYVRILRRWATLLPADRIHMVTVPTSAEPGDGLWERFLGVLDVDPGKLTVGVNSVNSSLSAAQAEFVRALNTRLQPDRITWERYEQMVKVWLVGEILFKDQGGAPQRLTAAHQAWASAQSAAMAAAIRSAGYDIAGTLDDLAVGPMEAESSVAPSSREVLDVALDAFAEVISTAPLPQRGTDVRTRAKNALRRVHRRVLGLKG